MNLNLKIIPTDLLETYKKMLEPSLKRIFDDLNDSEISIDTFSFYTSVSAVFSSKIEGENIELDSYIIQVTTNSSFTGMFGGNTVNATEYIQYSTVHPIVQNLVFDDTVAYHDKLS